MPTWLINGFHLGICSIGLGLAEPFQSGSGVRERRLRDWHASTPAPPPSDASHKTKSREHGMPRWEALAWG
jgi:hypothetical protein